MKSAGRMQCHLCNLKAFHAAISVPVLIDGEL